MKRFLLSLKELEKRIARKDASVAVIGLGYVGLPVAACFAEAGFDVLGLDIDETRLAKIDAGLNPIEGEEPGLADLLADVVKSRKLSTTSDYGQLTDRDVILISVETPVDEQHVPRYDALRNVLESLGPQLKDEALVVVESTIAPGTTAELVLPALEAGSGRNVGHGFYLGHCPERVMPGKLLHNLRTLSRVVGGMDPETAEAMTAFYSHVVEGDLDPSDCVTAELVKTCENAYRDVQIAFANEVALVAEAVGGDVWKVRELVNKSPGRHMLLPGAGVGGHCIPKDPWLLAHGAGANGVDLRLIPAARHINNGMPAHMADLVRQALEAKGKPLKGARVLVMGYAYLENSDDTRNSPSAVLIEILEQAGAEIVVHDPFVSGYHGDLMAAAAGSEVAVLMVKHQAYAEVALKQLVSVMQSPVLVDGRGLYSRVEAEAAGFQFTGIGQG